MIHPFILTFFVALIIQLIFFILAYTFKTDKVTDLAYGLSFIVLAWYLVLSQANFSLPALTIAVLITLWGLRLASYLLIRILKMGRDKRFDQIRNNFISFLKFWVFQAMAVWVIMLPSIYLITRTSLSSLNFYSWWGMTIFILGLLIETVADWQKFKFKNNPANQDKWIESGIWRCARHPNYFGEMILWWGIFIFTIPWQNGWSWLTMMGPIFITFILLFVSGIPPLEKRYQQKYANNKKYQQYKNRTSLLIPWWPKT